MRNVFFFLLVLGVLGAIADTGRAQNAGDSDQVEFLLFEGGLDLDGGRVLQAIKAFEKALELDPERFEAHLYYVRALIRGIGESQLEDPAEAARLAMSHCRWILDRDPGNREAQLGIQFLETLNILNKPPPFGTDLGMAAWERAQKALENDNPRLAIKELTKASKLEPDVLAGHRALGDVLLEEGRESEAVDSYRNGLEQDPRDYDLLVALANAYEKTGDDDLALAQYRTAFEIRPSGQAAAKALVRILEPEARETRNVETMNLVGRAQLSLGQLEEAGTTLERSLEIETTLAAKKGLGISQYMRGNDAEALPLLEEVHRESPEDIEVRYYIGASQLRRGKTEEGRNTLKSLLEVAPRNPNAMRLLGLSLADDPAEAETAAKLLIAAHSAGAWVQNLPCILGTLYMRLHHTLDASRAFEDCLELNPDYAGAYFGLGVVADDLGRTREAIDFLKEYLEREENPDRSAVFRLGVAYLRSGQDEPGFETLRGVVQPNPAGGDTTQLTDTELLEATSYFLAAVRRYKDAIFIGEMLLSRDSDNAIYNNNLAMTYADANKKPGRAHALAQKANRLSPRNPGHMDTLGWALARLSRLEEAEETLLASIELANEAGLENLSEIYYHLGFVYHKLDRGDEALEYLGMAMENPPSPYLRKEIQDLLERQKKAMNSR